MSRPAAPVHTDHPLRHWDRTCPACLAEYEAEHQPESETPEPETDALLKARPALWGGWNSADLHALEMHARSLERRLRLAQTEIKGHMRVEDELKAELERERMRVVGCSVAALGNWKEGDSLHADYDCVAIRDVAKLRVKYDEAQARIAELEKLLIQVREEWYGYTPYSKLKQDIDAALKSRA